MIKIEGENGIFFENFLNSVQKRTNIPTRKETLKYVVKAIRLVDTFDVICDAIILLMKQEALKDIDKNTSKDTHK